MFAFQAVAKGTKHLVAPRSAVAHELDACETSYQAAQGLEKEQMALAQRALGLRPKLLAPATEHEAATGLVGALGQRAELLSRIHSQLRAAATALRPVVDEAGMAGYDRFWNTIRMG
jgi:hypothetical protein